MDALVYHPNFLPPSRIIQAVHQDLIAGVIMAIIALPCRLPLPLPLVSIPVVFTAVVAGFLFPFLGGSRVWVVVRSLHCHHLWHHHPVWHG